ncbi:MAG: DUF192 domain-containing protein [Candidatus Paceibacterota bacterium]
MDLDIVLINRKHNLKHYAGLSLQTALVYLVFICGLFSVPAAKLIAEKMSEMEVERGVIGETSVTLDIVESNEERAKGLSGVVSMPKNHGMLFIFEKSASYGMWMKEMNFSLDIIWLNQFSEIVHIEKNVSPDTFPKVFSSPTPARFVLEFNAGFVDRNHIKMGDKFVLF